MCLCRQIMEPSLGSACVGDAPYSPMMTADVTKAAHRLVNVVDATTNTKKPLWSSTHESRVATEAGRTYRNDRNGRLTRIKKTETNVWKQVKRAPMTTA